MQFRISTSLVTLTSMLTINQLDFSYPTFHLHAQDLRFEAGEVIALVGQNGCGKTTFLHGLSGLLKGTSRITVDGNTYDSLRDSPLCHVHMNAFSPLSDSLTIEQHARVYQQLYQRYDCEQIQTVALQSNVLSLLDRKPSQLSAGQLTLVRFFLVRLVRPDVLTLDEPTTAIDIANIELVLSVIQQCSRMGMLIFFSSHHLHDLMMLQPRMIGLSKGQIKFDMPWQYEMNELPLLRSHIQSLILSEVA